MIDWVQVNTLREEVGRESFDEIVEIFLEEVEEVIDRLRNAPDLVELGNDLHFLKGSALNLGFVAFSDQCRLGESTAAAGNAQGVDLNQLVVSYDNSKTKFMLDMTTSLNA